MKQTDARVFLSKSGAAPMKIESASAPSFLTEPSQDDIRAYAFHLYEQGDGAPGHDLDNWFEATACLKAAIPADSSHSRLHRHIGASIRPAAHEPALISHT